MKTEVVAPPLMGIGVYFTDPDGNRLEFFCETAGDDESGKLLMT